MIIYAGFDVILKKVAAVETRNAKTEAVSQTRFAVSRNMQIPGWQPY